jgi:hypothetical protein
MLPTARRSTPRRLTDEAGERRGSIAGPELPMRPGTVHPSRRQKLAELFETRPIFIH